MSADPVGVRDDLLLVSNGFGEMAVATYIARALRAASPDARIDHFPLVGKVTDGVWPAGVGPQRVMPSGGLVAYWNLRNLWADLRAGLIGLTISQFRFLTAQRQRDVVIAVGDIYCLGLCLLGARRPTIFVATAKSDWVAPHSALERAIARHAVATFARDAVTAESLRRAGVNAQYAGNIMMDGMARTGIDLKLRPGSLVIAVLPGSRADAPSAAATLAGKTSAIASLLAPRGRTVQALFSAAPTVDARRVSEAIRATGIDMTDEPTSEGIAATGLRDNLEVAVVRGAFGDVLDAADIVIGQAGTANEQAAGCGKPVVAAAEPGEAPDKMRWYRMRQKRLLGDALLVLPSDPHVFAAEVVRLIDDPARMQHMSSVGRARMGSSGGARAVAGMALSVAQSRTPA